MYLLVPHLLVLPTPSSATDRALFQEQNQAQCQAEAESIEEEERSAQEREYANSSYRNLSFLK
jgi:hypothetical protein